MTPSYNLTEALAAARLGHRPMKELLADPKYQAAMRAALELLQLTCSKAMQQVGWWQDAKTGRSIKDNPLCFSNKLALIHSEVSEAMEGDRKGLPDDKLPEYEMRCVELGDALIRIFDLAGNFDMPLPQATVDKMVFNMVRPDHKLANRAAAGGKSY